MAQTSKVAFDGNEFTLNRNQWTLEQLAPYRGQWIAWNLDGKSIVAYHEDMAEVCRITQVLGYDGGDVLLSFLPAEEEIWY